MTQQQADFRQQAETIERLVVKLDTAADPLLKAVAKDLVQALMALHGAAFERALELLHELGNPGGIIERLGRDELVASVLLLYGLHPEDMRARILSALENIRPGLNKQNASAELVGLDDAGAVTIHFQVKAGSCGSTPGSVRSRIEAAVQNAAPDASSITLKDVGIPSSGAAFVPLTALQGSTAATVSPQPPAQRSGD
jgi:Fe-S cluster biogenesis protein NfuA